MIFKKLLVELYQNIFFLPSVVLLAFLVMLLETIKYPGFVGNHFYIKATAYFAVAITLLLFSTLKSRLMENVFKLNKIFLIPLLTIYFILNLAEGEHYTNYVLNIFRIHLDGMVYLVLFSLSVFLTGKFKNEIPKHIKGLELVYPIFILTLVFFIAKNTPPVTHRAFIGISYVLLNLNDSYDDRLASKWGIFYRFMVFVKNNTPLDATIIIPPEQDPWLMGSGNDNFVRAFLYPRKVRSETIIIPDTNLKSFGPNTYILITWGKESCRPEPECHGWPRQDIPVSRIIYKNPDSSEIIEVKENTIYKLNGSPYVYGIIKI